MASAGVVRRKAILLMARLVGQNGPARCHPVFSWFILIEGKGAEAESLAEIEAAGLT
jgi:hypothetical protein